MSKDSGRRVPSPTLLFGVCLALLVPTQVRSSGSSAALAASKNTDPSRHQRQIAGDLLTHTAHSMAEPPSKDHGKCRSERAKDSTSLDATDNGAKSGDDSVTKAKTLALWKQTEITLTVDGSFPKAPGAIGALRAAADAWTSSARELPKVKLRLADDNFVEVDDEGSRAEHRLYFAPDGDKRTRGALAVTVTTVDVDQARILDGDIIIDGSHWFPDLHPAPRDADSSQAWYDLQSVLTHELGHWFGLPEDYCNPDATMYAYTQPGEILKRDLAQSDMVIAQVAYWQDENPTGEVGCRLVKPTANSPLWPVISGAAVASWMRARRTKERRPWKSRSQHS